MTARKPLRLVHTSDVHLGMEDRHDLATGAFGRVVDGVQALDADMLLVVGDLFDNARVSDELVEYFVDQVRRLDVPVVVLPGNHDLYDSTSVYHRDPFADIPGNLHVFTDHEGEVLDFPALGLSLWGRAMRAHTPDFRPLQGIPPRSNGNWYVALAHGHLYYPGEVDHRASPIYPEEIAAAGCDYVALGHWDRHLDVSQGKVRARYSGGPMPSLSGVKPGYVALVELDQVAGVRVHQWPLGRAGSP